MGIYELTYSLMVQRGREREEGEREGGGGGWIWFNDMNITCAMWSFFLCTFLGTLC